MFLHLLAAECLFPFFSAVPALIDDVTGAGVCYIHLLLKCSSHVLLYTHSWNDSKVHFDFDVDKTDAKNHMNPKLTVLVGVT